MFIISRHFKAGLLASCLVAFNSHGEVNLPVPGSKLRPLDPASFFSDNEKLTPADFEQMQSILAEELKRDDVAELVGSKKSLDIVPKDAEALAAFLGANSQRVKEWALKALGEDQSDKGAVTHKLLRLISDTQAEDSLRALAARVVGTSDVQYSESARVLADQMPEASKELRVIFLETLGEMGASAESVLPDLKKYLDDHEAAVQFHAFRAIQRIDAQDDTAKSKQVRFSDLASVLNVLNKKNAPKYLTCLALQKLLIVGGQRPEAIPASLEKIASSDAFISELAAMVLDRLPMNGTSLNALSQALQHTNAAVRLQAGLALRKGGGQESASTANALATALEQAREGKATLPEVGALLDALRNMGTNASVAASSVVGLLPEQCPIYRDLQKFQIHRVRAFLFVTLAEIGVPKQATPFVLDALTNSDDRSGYEFAGAARAAGGLEGEASKIIPLLVRPLKEKRTQSWLSFEKFETHINSSAEYTTCQIEALRALGKMGRQAKPIIPDLKEFLAGTSQGALSGRNKIPSVRAETEKALLAISGE